jgi:PKD repeat protein
VTDGNTCFSFTPADTNVAYVGKDTLCVSTNLLNNTPTWTIVSALGQNIKAIKATPYNRNTVYVVTANAKLYRIENATSGTPQITILSLPSSSNISASVDVVMSDTNVVYVACNSKVYRSSNRGQTWTNITNNYPNINVINLICDYYSVDESVYIGCATGVYYRNNALSSWVNYSGGLPSIAHITDFMMFNDGTGASKIRVSYYGKGVWECPLNKSQLPLASFMAASTQACAGEAIQFTDLSANAISRQWYFQGGTPSTSTALNPLVTYSTPGVYLVSLQVTNSIGNNSLVISNYITISSAHALPLSEGFENNYPQFWTTKDDGDDGVGWVLSGNAGGYGNSLNAMLFDNYNNDANGKRDEFRTPQLNFQNLDSVNLTFDVSYARYDGGYHDTLSVLVSTDCGNTFTEVYNKGYSDLATAPDNTGFFIPDPTQWRTETVSLTPYINEPNLMIIFQNRGHYGNSLYIDNVNLSAYTVSSPVADIAAYNRIVCEGSSVQFADLSSGNPLSHAWTFSGGNPSASFDANPVVVYSNVGTYDVTLTVNNANGSDTKTFTGFITVLQPSLTSTFNVNLDTIYATTSAIAYQWLFNSTIIPGASSQSYIMTQNGTYSLMVTDSNGCSSLSLPYSFTVGLADLNLGNTNIHVFPNPTGGEKNLHVILTNSIKGNSTIQLLDLMGRVVLVKQISVLSDQQELQLNLTGVVPGIYLLTVNGINSRSAIRIVVD